MKRRRWWFIGLAVVLLAACVFVWKWSERPPFKFLESATLEDLWIRTGLGPDTALTEYRLALPFAHVVDSARKEMEPLGWSGKQYGKDFAFSPHTDIDKILAQSVNISPPLSAGEPVRIAVARHATWWDRARVWLRHVLRP